METKSDKQEIDLLELLAGFYGYLRKNWVLTVLLPLIGALLGLAFYLGTPYKIQSKMMVVTEVLTETECDFLLLQLEKSDSLGVFMFGQIDEKVGLKHTMKRDAQSKNVHIEIIGKVRDSKLLIVVQNKVLAYLEESEQSRKRKADSKEYFKQMVVEIDQELQSLEEVKAEFDNKTKATFLNPSDLFTASLNLRERKINAQMRLNDIKSFRLVQGFSSMSKKVKMPALFTLAIGFVGGTLILMITLFVKFFLGYYKRYQQTHAT